MKLTKGMKKALSLLLSAAMVVTGVNVTVNTANAADSSESAWVTITAQEYNGSKNLTGKAQVTGTGDYEIEITGFSGVVGNLGFIDDWASTEGKLNAPDNVSALKLDLKSVVVNGEYEMAVPSSAAWAKDKNPFQQFQNGFPNQWNKMGITDVIVSSDDASLKFYDASTSQKGAIGLFVGDATAATQITSLTYKFTVTSIKFVGTTTTPTQAPAGDDTAAPVTSGGATQAPTGGNTAAPSAATNTPADSEAYEGSMSKFSVYMNYVSDSEWGEQNWDVNEVEITKDGEYTADYYVQGASDNIFMLILSTNLKNGSLAKDFKLAVTNVKVGDKDYAVDEASASKFFGFADSNIDKAFRYNIRNTYVPYPYGENLLEDRSAEWGDAGCDSLNGVTVPAKAGDTVTVSFKVSGMDPNAEKVTFVDPNKATQAPATQAPTTPSTQNSITTPSGVTTPGVVGTKAIKFGKKKATTIVVAPNKSKTVKFSTTVAAPATQKAVVTASIAKKSIVSKAVVTDNKVKITAAKKATRGASTKVTLKSTDAAGKTVSAKITVKIENKAKKVKAAKKSITIKKGKKAKLTLKVTAQNKKKATTDTVKVSSKVVKLAGTSAKKGKVVVTLKGKKKGSQKVTIKVGSKKVKVSVKVK